MDEVKGLLKDDKSKPPVPAKPKPALTKK
jgi:hypothetical protein